MARKTTPTRRSPAPVPAALERLAKLAAAGTVPDRMAREAQSIITAWRAEPELDSGDLRERLETLRDDMAAGVTDAEEQAGDVYSSDKAAARQAAATVAGLRAVQAVVQDELG